METDAARFLSALAPDGMLTFSTFTDGEKRQPDPLARNFFGGYPQFQRKLEQFNEQGAGVFVMVNRGDGRARKNSNVVAVRAIFLDLDGAPLEPVLKAPIAPAIVCESSPGKYHAYWPVRDMPLADFRGAQRALATCYGGDPVVSDLARVMRMPGHMHRKGEPFRSRLLHCDPVQPWPWTELAEALNLPCSICPAPTTFREGTRNDGMFRFACGLRQQNVDRHEALRRVGIANAERCVPPLDGAEIEALVASAWQQPRQDRYVALPHSLLDSEEFRAVSDGTKVIIVALARQFTGSNNGRLTLTRTQADEWGISKGRRARGLAEAEHAGLIEYTAHAMPAAPGRRPTPDLFRLTYLPG